MVRITIDEDLKQKLFSTGEVVELCDSSGQVLGEVRPRESNAEQLAASKPLTPEISEQELDQLANSDDWTGITTAEVKAHLRSRP